MDFLNAVKMGCPEFQPNGNPFYVYIHINLRTGLPFYVGKGVNRRGYNHTSRSREWKALKKGPVWTHIFAKGLKENEAFAQEALLISVLDGMGYELANKTQVSRRPALASRSSTIHQAPDFNNKTRAPVDFTEVRARVDNLISERSGEDVKNTVF